MAENHASEPRASLAQAAHALAAMTAATTLGTLHGHVITVDAGLRAILGKGFVLSGYLFLIAVVAEVIFFIARVLSGMSPPDERSGPSAAVISAIIIVFLVMLAAGYAGLAGLLWIGLDTVARHLDLPFSFGWRPEVFMGTIITQ